MLQTFQLIQITPHELAVMVAIEVANALKPYLAQLQTPPEDPLFTRAEVCKKLNITGTTLWSITKQGKIKSQQIGRRILYRASDVEAALTQRNFGRAVK